MYSIQMSHDNTDWRYMPDSPFMSYNGISDISESEKNIKWLRDNTGAFYRVVETITPDEIDKFIEWLLDDDDCLETVKMRGPETNDLVKKEAAEYFGQTMSLDLFTEINQKLAKRIE